MIASHFPFNVHMYMWMKERQFYSACLTPFHHISQGNETETRQGEERGKQRENATRNGRTERGKGRREGNKKVKKEKKRECNKR